MRLRYIYGGAINGLTALGDVYPKEIIPILAQQAADTSRSVEQRLKVNESLLKISQRCGETLPFHGLLFAVRKVKTNVLSRNSGSSYSFLPAGLSR